MVLAQEIQADYVVMDDQLARRKAQRTKSHWYYWCTFTGSPTTIYIYI